MKRLDINGDGVLSAREFKQWLFPQLNQQDKKQLAIVLNDIINRRFDGDVKLFYSNIKR